VYSKTIWNKSLSGEACRVFGGFVSFVGRGLAACEVYVRLANSERLSANPPSIRASLEFLDGVHSVRPSGVCSPQ
jgi:hypothetical protein